MTRSAPGGSAAPRPATSAAPGGVPRLLGGYRVLEVLGSRPEGVTVRARALARGDTVVVDSIESVRAGGPPAVALAARWALAASLVRHPNLARVRGLGRSGDRLLIASDDVPGRHLGECGLDREGALVAVLQAARALRTLHERGLAHGRVSAPSIRYAGQGLFRLVGAGTTPPPFPPKPDPANPPRPGAGAPSAAPRALEMALAEAQAADRAALGRVLDQATRRERRGERVPDPEMHRVVERLTGKAGSGESYHDLGQAIIVLEGILGVPRLAAEVRQSGAGDVFAEAAQAYSGAPTARIRRQVVLGSIAALCAFLVLTILLHRWGATILLAAFGAAIAGAWWLARVAGRPDDPWRTRLRDWLLGGRWQVTASLALIALAVLWAIGWLSAAAVLILIALALGLAAHLALDRPLEDQRCTAITHAADAIEELRWLGLDEPAIENLVADSAGPIAPGLVRRLLGDRTAARCRATGIGGTASYEAAASELLRRLLDQLAHRLDARLRHRRADRLAALLRQVEEDRIVAEGVNLLTARRRARRIASALLAVAAEIRQADRTGSIPMAIGPAIDTTARNAEAVLLDHEAGLIDERRRTLNRVLELAFSPSVRLVAGALLLAGWVLWLHQNGLIPDDQLRDLAGRASTVRDLDSAQDLGAAATDLARRIDPTRARQELVLPPIPATLTRLVHGFAPAVAGLLLVVSAAMRGGWRLGVLAFAGAGAVLIGPKLAGPSLGPVPAELAAAAVGLTLLAAGRWLAAR